MPKQVAVIVANDDDLFYLLYCPQLTSIDLNLIGLDYKAAAIVNRLICGDPTPTEPVPVTPLGVIARESTVASAIDSPKVVKALTLIRQKVTPGLAVQQVLDAVGGSRRSLEEAFRTHLACSPLEEIPRVQIDHAKHLLERTYSVCSV